MPKETATERRAREAAEARIAQEKWEAKKLMRLLKALARVPQGDFNISGTVCMAESGEMKCAFWTPDTGHIVAFVDELTEWTMQYIETAIDNYEEKRKRDSYMLALRAELLSKMTDEEKEALGL